MSRAKGTCSRPNCDRILEYRGLCKSHYDQQYPLQGYVDPAPTAAHIEVLRSRGFTLDTFEEHGISRSVIARILKGEQRIHARTEHRILTLQVPAVVFRSCAEVPGLGTRRRVQALAVLGWSQTALAERMGLSQSRLANYISRDRVYARTAAAVAALYEELQWKVGPSQISRDRAKQKGWFPPAAWDDIDDPAETPNVGGPERRSDLLQDVADRREQVAQLTRAGLSAEQIADRIGVSKRNVSRYRAALREAS